MRENVSGVFFRYSDSNRRIGMVRLRVVRRQHLINENGV